jgi:dUTP diphosphatase
VMDVVLFVAVVGVIAVACAVDVGAAGCAQDFKQGDEAMTKQKTKVRVLRLPHGADLPLPAYQTDHAAGLDLVAAVAAGDPIVIAPGGRAAIPTGLVIALPAGLEGQIRPRSGLALRHGITVLNAPGTLDADYRGEVLVVLANFGREPFPVARGTRIAQLVVAPFVRADMHEVPSLDDK